MTMFKGSGVAIVTPFNEDGTVNFECYERLVNFQIENGTDAIISCGTTGEASTLTDDEQIEVIKCAVSAAKKRVPVIAGAGSNDTEHGVRLCKASQQAGADGCLLVTPYYNKTSQRGLIKHFETLAKSIDIPIMLYSVPTRTKLVIEPKTIYELCKVDNIVAIKDANNDIVKTAETVELCGDKIDIYSGNDDQIVPILSLGGIGVVSVLANVAPKQTHDMVMSYLNGDLKTSLKLQIEALELVRALFIEVSPMPVKAALNLMGFNVGNCRMPLVDLEERNLQTLKQAMETYGIKTSF